MVFTVELTTVRFVDAPAVARILALVGTTEDALGETETANREDIKYGMSNADYK